MMTNLRVVFLLQLEAMKQRLATVTEDKYNSEDKVIKLSDELEKKVFILLFTILVYLFISIFMNFYYFLYILDVHSLASRSRQSEKQPIVDELALIEHSPMGRSFRARRTVTTCHG